MQSLLCVYSLSLNTQQLYVRRSANPTASAAHDQALSRAGKQITAGDVIKAITEMDFGPADALVPILEQELAGEFAGHHIVYRFVSVLQLILALWQLTHPAFRSHAAAVKASKAKPPGPGRGRRRKSAVDQAEGEGDVSMAADGDEDEDDDDEAEEGEGEGEEGEEGDDGEEDEVDDAA